MARLKSFMPVRILGSLPGEFAYARRKMKDHYVEQEYTPPSVKYYEHTDLGFEKEIKERLNRKK